MKTCLSALPALLLVLLFPVVIIALVVAGVIFVGWLALHHVNNYVVSRVLIFLLVPLVGSLAFAWRDVRRSRGSRVTGAQLGRAQAPELWALVDELARRSSTRTVDRIVVLPEVNAAVSQVKGERTLVIGLPMLVTWTKDELTAVLAHELGHYAGGHFALSSLVLRAQGRMVALVQNSTGLWQLVFQAYLWLFLVASRASSRELERAADRSSVRIAGSAAAIAAFDRIDETDAAWAYFVANYAPLVPLSGRRALIGHALVPLAEAVRAHPAGRAPASLLQGSWWDSHPPTVERVNAARAAALPPSLVQPGMAHELVGGCIDALEAEALGGQGPVVSWQEVVAVGEPVEAAQQSSRILARLAERRAIAAPTLRCALEANQVRPLAEGATDLLAANRVLLAWLVRSALLRTPGHRAVLDWHRPGRVDGPGGMVDLKAMIGDGGPQATSGLCARLEAMGVALDVPAVDPDARPEGPDDVLAVLTTIECTMLPAKDLVILPSGLLLMRSCYSQAAVMSGRMAPERQARDLAQRLEQGMDVLRAGRGHRWIPAEQVASIHVQALRMGGTVLRIETLDGKVFKGNGDGAYSLRLGEPWKVLAERYPGRCVVDEQVWERLAKKAERQSTR